MQKLQEHFLNTEALMKTRHSLMDIYAEHEGYVSDKWDIYLNAYDRLFKNLETSAVSLLEIGIQNGGSLEIWNTLFPHSKIIVGCDINPDCAQLKYDSEKIKLLIGNINDSNIQRQLDALSNEFDIIIDDGSHTSSDIITSFFLLFPKLNIGGIYIIEDLHCSYWQSFEGGLFNKSSSMNFLKSLTDIINHEHWGVPISKSQLLAEFNIPADVETETLLSEIHSIEFVNSMCIITKNKPQNNVLGVRHVVGSQELVAKNKFANGGFLVPEPQQSPVQTSSNLESEKDKKITSLTLEISELKRLLKEAQPKNG
ncbi:class I SAM-dependent methyltransferase [Pseudomonas syringae]|uniref:class I SAM-dependent methyltransferase n=1 Tax=Pseudomonas syringae TaxID=317 RepID=UPI0019170E8F|nr:class I SAM-dependent methyltransferase [Pseudomonas syringae]QQQ51574.1 class I SAM-dependent methyltransferase [Pseudomonas syringae]